MTKECCWCNFTDEEKQSIIFESAYWYVFLADNQDYIGRCVIVLKRHSVSLSDIDLSEWIELKELINRLEKCFEKIPGRKTGISSDWICDFGIFFGCCQNGVIECGGSESV